MQNQKFFSCFAGLTQIDLLLAVLGISTPFTAIRILAEIGADMSVFETAIQLTSWAGLTPRKSAERLQESRYRNYSQTPHCDLAHSQQERDLQR